MLLGVAGVDHFLNKLLQPFLAVRRFQQMHLINIRYAVLVAFAAGNADQVLVFVHIKGDGIKCFFHIQKSPFPLVLPLIISDCVEKYNRLC